MFIVSFGLPNMNLARAGEKQEWLQWAKKAR